MVDINALGKQGMPELHRDMGSYDRELLDFLQELDDAAVDLDVSDWEAEFIESNLTRCAPFTLAQRDVIERMREKYEGAL